jgi:hypothetical protein
MKPVREKLLWFFLGAIAAGPIFAFAMWRLAPAQQAPMATIPQDRGELARQLARIDRRLAAIESRSPAPTGPAAAQAVPAPTRLPAPTAAELRAVEAGTDIVNRAISVGLWTRRDAAEMRSASAGMNEQGQIELMRQMVVAINEDRLKVEPGADLQ